MGLSFQQHASKDEPEGSADQKNKRGGVTVQLHEPEHFQQNAPKVFDALQLMRQYSPLGRRLVNWAEKHEHVFVEKDMKPLGRCCAGPLSVKISAHVDNSVTKNISVLAHELMHGVQGYSHNRLKDAKNWDARALILHNRALEAGAETCAIRVCFEMKQNGYPDAFDEYYKDNNAYSILFEIFEHTYEKSMAEDKKHDDAIQDACDESFHAYYKNQRVIDAYNAGVLKRYIDAYLNDGFSKETPFLGRGENGSRGMTELNTDEFLVSHVKPDVSDVGIFGDNELMRQAFEHVETLRMHRYSGGDTNFCVQRYIMALEEDNNPYVDQFKMNKALVVWNERETDTFTPNMLEIMNELAGLGNVKQFSLDFGSVSPKTQTDENVRPAIGKTATTSLTS